MTINFTLVVQAANFLFAYLMIRKLLLKPAYDCICQDDAVYEQACAKVAQQKEQVKRQDERIKERWRAYQQAFLDHEPPVARAQEVEVAVIPGIPSLPPIDEKQVHRLAHETTQQLIEKVAHVD